jgi:hypothetical protein
VKFRRLLLGRVDGSGHEVADRATSAPHLKVDAEVNRHDFFSVFG